MSALTNLPKPFFVLAPMDDVTDTVFRRIVGSCAAPDVYFTEFVNVDGLQSPGRARLLKKLVFTADETPLIAQIWGKDIDNFRRTAEQLADGTFARELGLPEGVNFAGIDINMGCPVKNVVSNGTCSALMNDPERAVAIIRAVQEGAAGRLPVSVKTRLGFGAINHEFHETLLKENLDMLTIHGRTRSEMSKVPAQWGAIEEVRKLRDQIAPETLIVGNGDVMSHAQGVELATKHGLDGVMVGRGIFQDPFIFSKNTPWEAQTPKQRLELYIRQVELFAATWQDRERPIHTLNKFCKIYINGFDGAQQMREELMAANSADELLNTLDRELVAISSL
jgi:tRNA-dihydrouridine synthase